MRVGGATPRNGWSQSASHEIGWAITISIIHQLRMGRAHCPMRKWSKLRGGSDECGITNFKRVFLIKIDGYHHYHL